MILEDSEKKLTEQARQLIERCRVSVGDRTNMYRNYTAWVENGRADSRTPATANLLYGHKDRLASHLMSPSDMRFVIDTENNHPKEVEQMCAVAARVLSREWERQNIDMMFAQGVAEALTYGSVIPKLLARETSRGNDRQIKLHARLVMPWNFGVLNESNNSLDEQEAVCETVYLTRYEVWRMVRHLSDAEAMYKRIISQTSPDQGAGGPDGYMHQVLLGAVNAPINPSMPMQAPGLVDVGGNQYQAPAVQVAEDLYPMHELWVRNDDRNNDHTTIRLIEPDILLSPRAGHMRQNLFAPDTLPYGFICPNMTPGRFWGRSEIADLIEPQKLLTGLLDDYRLLMGVQFEKLLAFVGEDTITDENYQGARKAGYFNLSPNSRVEDLTAKIPPEALPLIQFVIQTMERISGFSNIMSGQGEPGVRSDVHANTLSRMSSPRLRDRSLLVERQCAAFADASLSCLEAKEARVFWVDPDDGGKTDFTLDQLPDDRRVSVDAHSTSPIYHDDNANLMAFGLKSGYITGESMIEYMAYTNKEILLRRYKEKEAAQMKLMLEHPELFHRGGRQRH